MTTCNERDASPAACPGPAAPAALTKADLNRIAWRSILVNASFNYERMQATGFGYSILPVLQKVHADKDGLAAAMRNHLTFINCHSYAIALIMGICAAMEERKENPELIQSAKVALMGPLAGLGDSLIWYTLMPILAGIGVSFAMEGNPLGPLFFFCAFNALELAMRFGFVHWGYRLGIGVVDRLRAVSDQVVRSATILGMTVVGALVASYVSLSTPLVLVLGEVEVNLQEELFDAIMPCLLPLLFTLGAFYLVRRKQLSPVLLILATVLISLAGVFFGIL